jgi:DNA-binding MarR family transcriptional regulator
MDPDGLNTDELVTRLRAVVGKISRAMDREVGSGELTRTQFTVLGTTVRRGPIRLGDLAERENINPTMLSRVVAKLDAIGYIARKPDPADQRAALIVATASGARAHAEIRAQRTALMARRLGELPPEAEIQLRAALPALEQLAGAMLQPRTREEATASTASTATASTWNASTAPGTPGSWRGL